MTILTDLRYSVLAVHPEDGVKVTLNGAIRWIGWETLRAAAQQPDRELAEAYGRILRTAEGRAARGTIYVTVDDMGTGGHAWTVTVRDAAGNDQRLPGWVQADELMQHHHRTHARREAAEIADRIERAGRDVRRHFDH